MRSIHLLPQAKAILDKYDAKDNYALPKFSNQKINSYLIEIGGIVGINKSISHHMARNTFANTVLLYNYGKVVQKRVGEEMDKLLNSAKKALLKQKKKILAQLP